MCHLSAVFQTGQQKRAALCPCRKLGLWQTGTRLQSSNSLGSIILAVPLPEEEKSFLVVGSWAKVQSGKQAEEVGRPEHGECSAAFEVASAWDGGATKSDSGDKPKDYKADIWMSVVSYHPKPTLGHPICSWMGRLPAPSRQATAGSCAQEEMLARGSGRQPDAFPILVSLAVMNSTMSAERWVQQESRGSGPSDLRRPQNTVFSSGGQVTCIGHRQKWGRKKSHRQDTLSSLRVQTLVCFWSLILLIGVCVCV